MRDNDYLTTCYPPPQPSLLACLHFAFFRLHNETLNVYTHFIGFILFISISLYLYLLPIPENAHPSVDPYILKLSLVPLLLAAIICMLFSFSFHALWFRSPQVQALFAKLDFVGISLLCCGHALTGIYHLYYCHEPAPKVYYWAVVILEICTLFAIFHPLFSTPAARPVRVAVFMALGSAVVWPMLHAGMLKVERLVYMLTAAFLSLLIYFFGAVIYVLRWPERYAKEGKYDCVGASHQIMHVAVVVACTVHVIAMLNMVKYRWTHGCKAFAD